ncbi:MAG TPA: hypothetical protein VNK95_22960 [Caldilineaceae bacterium]|nr:hypothetical protein [Caldilineaceae bacterium]
MSSEAVTIFSFIIFLAFFGWLGWRRGARREIIVFIIALVSWLLIQEVGDVFVNIANLGAAAFTFASAGGFTGSQEEAFAALTSAPQIVNDDNRQAYLYLLWLVVFVITYIMTNNNVEDKRSPRNGWAVLFGVLNGLFFALAFVPSIAAMFAPDGTLEATGEAVNFFALLGNGLRLLWEGVSGLWGVVENFGSLGLLIMLTLFLVLAASTIRGGAKAKS